MREKKFIEDREQLEKLAPMLKAPIKRQVFVCTGKSCSEVGGREVMAEFDRILVEKGLRQGKESKGRNPMGECVLTECGSIGFCSIGVAVMVYPDGTIYGQVQPEDVVEIVEEHLSNNRVVARLSLLQLPIAETNSDSRTSESYLSMEEFLKNVGDLLRSHEYPPYERQGEGLVYVGPPNKIDLPLRKKEYFVHLFCLLVAFDLKVFESFPHLYSQLKPVLRVPKFEYGLTNTFYYPEEIFREFRVPCNRLVLSHAFNAYESYVQEGLIRARVRLDLHDLHRMMIGDPDINRGIWGREFCQFLESRLSTENNSDSRH